MDPLNLYYSSVDGVLFDKNQTALIQCPGAKTGNYSVPESVNSIENGAFSGCAYLTSVMIGSSVTVIEGIAFLGCSRLTTITVDPLNTFYSSVDGVLFDKIQTTLIQCPGGKDASYTIPEGVISIGPGAFYGCINLTSATIPDSVITIGPGAFYSCPSLIHVAISESVVNIGRDALLLCPNLTTITVDPASQFYSSMDGVLFNKGQTTLIQCPGGKSGDYKIPGSILAIERAAFAFCSSLTAITIGNSLTSLGDVAFAACTNLGGVYFEGSAPFVGKGIFIAADNVTVYYLPGTTGWGPTFDERPTEPWWLPYPLILDLPSAFGALNNQFGFIISWATNADVLVEASTDLANPAWSPVSTNTLIEGSSYFSDPTWTNHPARFYRLRSP